MKILRVLTAVLLLAVFAGLFKIKAAGKNALPDRSVKEPGPTVIAGTMAIAEILSDLEYKNVIGVPSSRHSLPELYKNTVIRHFSQRLFWLPYPHVENIKQWHITKVHKKFGYENFDDILYEYVYQETRFERDFK